MPKHVLKSPLISSLSQLEASKMSLVMAKFKRGDLVELTAFGRILCVDTDSGGIGIIMSDARNFYDVFVGNELIIDIPQNFMVRLQNNENEKDID